MADDVNINKNKIGDKQKRRAEHIEDKLEKQGVGQDEASKRALQEVAQEPNSGGGNSAGDAKKSEKQHGGHEIGGEKQKE
jgi:hypothetical protein